MKINVIFIPVFIVLVFCSCSQGKKLTVEYYKSHELALLNIKDAFKKIHRTNPFSLEIRDKNFSKLGLEIITDTIRYVYEFDRAEGNLIDTLKAYQFNINEMTGLLNNMKKLQCTWITNLDYHENRVEKFLIFLSLRYKKSPAGRKEKYFTLAFFNQSQHYDEKGRLLDNVNRKRVRKISDRVFYKINDFVSYSVAGKFR